MISIPAEWMAGVFMIWRSHRRFMMTDSSTLWLDPFDCDVALRDAALDESNRPTQRMIANASLGMHLEDAYYSVRELREAVTWVHEGVAGGKGRSEERRVGKGCVSTCRSRG